MNSLPIPRWSMAALALLLLLPASLLARADILPPQRRASVVEQVQRFVAEPVHEELDPKLNNPFYPNSLKPQEEFLPETTDEMAFVPAAPASVYELLDKIAPEINPTGMVTLGGHPLLLFGRSKVRVGDTLPVIYDGERYTLVISRIEPSSFTLRLGAAEVTRPIKSHSSP